jgi:hypothetical protein
MHCCTDFKSGPVTHQATSQGHKKGQISEGFVISGRDILRSLAEKAFVAKKIGVHGCHELKSRGKIFSKLPYAHFYKRSLRVKNIQCTPVIPRIIK